MSEVKKKSRGTKRKLLLGVAMLGIAPAAIASFGGGDVPSGGYIGPLPPAWFADEPCRTEPITLFEDQFNLYKEWQVDVSAVADDGDPNTFARCILEANTQVNTCVVGLADGTVVACADQDGPHALPQDGDMLYVFIENSGDFCDVYVGTHDRFGEADPKCRAGGDGDGDAPGGLGCNASNSTPVVTAAGTTLVEDQCYSYNKAAGTLRVGAWSQPTFDIHIEDSAMNSVSANITPGDYRVVGGVANGTIYFKVDVAGASSVVAQLDSW